MAVIKKISDWERSPSAHPFLWMYGPAGSGKTTIAQTMAEIFENDGTLGASFFFSRSAPGRPICKDQFVATIAYQLYITLRDLQPHIIYALVNNPDIFDKKLSKQVDELIVKPFNALLKARPNPISARCVILIDGLDECSPSESQKEILDTIVNLLSLPLLFLVSSRPESTIRAYFLSRSMLGLHTETLPLDDNYRSFTDIRAFIIAKFDALRHHHPAGRDLPQNWPNRRDIARLVGNSSLQFVCADVAMKYISDGTRHPISSLEEVIGVTSAKTTPFAALDALYTHALSTIPPDNLEYILDAFCWMMTPVHGHRYNFPLTSPIAKSMFRADIFFGGGRKGVTRTRMDGLHSLIDIPEDDTRELAFFHASFPDFLRDHSRSGQFYVDFEASSERLARHICSDMHFKSSASDTVFNVSIFSYTTQ